VCDEPVWWRPLGNTETEMTFVPLTEEDKDVLAAGLADNGRPPVGANDT
jgi:hypothetical protein